MAQQRRSGRASGGTGRNASDPGGGRERGTRSSERAQRDLSDQEREQRDLQRRGRGASANPGATKPAIRETRDHPAADGAHRNKEDEP